MSKIDETYHKLLKLIIQKGYEYEDSNRSGIYRKEIPSFELHHDFEDGFPAISTKTLFWKGVVGELLWFLRGDTNIKYLQDNKIHIWDKDVANFSKDGYAGRIYGAQWRTFGDGNEFIGLKEETIKDLSVDQISNLISELKNNPMSTRLIVTTWNPIELNNMALPPCHWSFQIIGVPIENNYGFYLKWNQRSVDTFLGLPFNIASYSLLAYILGEITGYKPLGIIGNLSNVHIYKPHINAAIEQLKRRTTFINSRCELHINDNFYKQLNIFNKDKNLNNFINSLKIEDFTLPDYRSQGKIKANMFEIRKKMYRLEKISDNRFDGYHPNFILEGMSWIGTINSKPKIGERFHFGTEKDPVRNHLYTSVVTEVLKDGIFKTLNSTYKLTKLKKNELPS